MSILRPLPRPLNLLKAVPFWRYCTPKAVARHGVAHLTLWSALHAGDALGFLAVVTDTGEGLSITNGMEHLWLELHGRYASFTRPLTLIEHYPARAGIDRQEHLDEAWFESNRPSWRRIWPTFPSHPEHDLLGAWADEHVPPLLEQARLAARTTPS